MERDNHPAAVDVPPTAGDGEIMDLRHRLQQQIRNMQAAGHVPPTAGDREIMDLLRRLLQQRSESGDAALGNMQAAAPLSEVSAHLASLHPSLHPPYGYVAAGPEWTSPATQGRDWRTQHGDQDYWKELYRFAVRRVATSAGSSSPYVGVTRELRFGRHNGTRMRTWWTMIQYQLLQERSPNEFSIEDTMMFCWVFRQGRRGQLHHQAATHVPEDSPTISIDPTEELDDEPFLSFVAEGLPIYVDMPVSELIRGTRRYRDNFINIFSNDDNGVPRRSFVACLCCNRMERADPQTHGTHVKRHYKRSCPCTAPGVKCSWTPPAH